MLLFGVVCIMAAGIGALGNQMLGLPVWLGAAIACVLIAAAAYFGLGGMVSVFTVAVPCMIVAALVIAGIRLHRAGLTAAAFAAVMAIAIVVDLLVAHAASRVDG